MTTSTSYSTLPMLLTATPTGTAAALSIALDFNTVMATGAGAIYITDGALQTVIDRATGLPTTRVVGGADTHVLSAADLVIDGNHVTLAVNGLLAGHTYSIVMDAGTLVSSDNLAFGGVRSTSQLQFTTAPAPIAAPALLSVDADGLALKAGGSIAVTLHFSEAVPLLTADALQADNATVTNLVTNDGGVTWHATLQAPAGAVTAANNTLSLDMSRVYDAAGHAGSGVSTLVAYAVDTDAPLIVTTPADTADVDANAGLVLHFSEAVHATDGAGRLELDDHKGNPFYVTLNDADWSADGKTLTIAPAALHLDAGSDYTASLLGGVTDLAGNALAANAYDFHTAGAYQDLTPPIPNSIDAVPGAGAYSVGATIEIDVNFGEAVTLIGAGDLTLRLNNGSVATFSHLSDDGMHIAFSYQVGVGDGETARLDLTDAGADLAGHVADAAGNVLGALDLSGYHLGADGAGIAIDVHADAPAAPQLAAASDSGVSGDDITENTAPVITGSGAEAGAHIHVNVGGAYVAVTDADANGNWTWSGLHDLEPGDYSVSAYQTDLAGNDSLVSEALLFTVAAPAAPIDPPPAGRAAPVLADASDSGVKGDNITNDSTPTLTGTAAAGMKKVNVYDGGVLLGHANVDDDGSWSYTVNNGHALADGVHQLTVRESLGPGGDDNYGAPSAALALTIDTTAPTLLSATASLHNSSTWFSLAFSEQIVVPANGGIDVDGDSHGGQSQHSGSVHTNWDIANNANGVASVLELNVGTMYGLVHLSLEGSGIQDVAGNVAIIGNASYTLPGF